MNKQYKTVGSRFGRVVITALLPDDMLTYACDCGTVRTVTRSSIHPGKKGCGCTMAETKRTHGQGSPSAQTPAYRSWQLMLRRCRRADLRDYPRYGGRGIRVCERWATFEHFFADMGPRPPDTTLDRINNDGDYEPGNCRWATPKQQAQTRATTARVTLLGRTQSCAEWAREIGISANGLAHRLSLGWPEADILKPSRRKEHHSHRSMENVTR